MGRPNTPSVYFIAVLSTRISLSLSSRGNKWKNNFSALFRMTTTNPRATFLITHSVSFANWICALSHTSSRRWCINQTCHRWYEFDEQPACFVYIKFSARVDSRPPRARATTHISLINNLAGGIIKFWRGPVAKSAQKHANKSVESFDVFFFSDEM